jgi:hypothetical protein
VRPGRAGERREVRGARLRPAPQPGTGGTRMRVLLRAPLSFLLSGAGSRERQNQPGNHRGAGWARSREAKGEAV